MLKKANNKDERFLKENETSIMINDAIIYKEYYYSYELTIFHILFIINDKKRENFFFQTNAIYCYHLCSYFLLYYHNNNNNMDEV